MDETLSVLEVARRLRRSPVLLRDPRWRRRVGLSAIRVNGRTIGFLARDVEALLQRARERFPAGSVS